MTSKGSRGADGSRRMSALALPNVLGAQVPALRRLRETVHEFLEPKDLVAFCRPRQMVSCGKMSRHLWC